MPTSGLLECHTKVKIYLLFPKPPLSIEILKCLQCFVHQTSFNTSNNYNYTSKPITVEQRLLLLDYKRSKYTL